MSNTDDNKDPLIKKDTLQDLIDRYKASDVAGEIEKTSSQGRITALPTSSLRLFPLLKEEDYDMSSLQEEGNEKAKGIDLPLLVFSDSGVTYVFGRAERFLLAKKLSLTTVPCLFIQATKEDIIAYVIEDLNKNSPNQLLIGDAFRILKENYGFKEKGIQKLTGLSHGQVAGLVRITYLDEKCRRLIIQKKLTLAKARLLLNLSPEGADALAEEFIGLDVRQCEERAREEKTRSGKDVRFLSNGYTYKVQGKTLIMDFNTAEGLLAFLKKIKEEG